MIEQARCINNLTNIINPNTISRDRRIVFMAGEPGPLGIETQRIHSVPKQRLHSRHKLSFSKEVIDANARLADDDRIAAAEALLKRPLLETQRKKFIKAHEVGLVKGEGDSISGIEPGKDGNPAGVGNYTREQLIKKIKLLKDAGISSATDRDKLIRSGLVGVDATGISDPAFVAIAGINLDPREAYELLSNKYHADLADNFAQIKAVPDGPDKDRKIAEIIAQSDELTAEYNILRKRLVALVPHEQSLTSQDLAKVEEHEAFFKLPGEKDPIKLKEFRDFIDNFIMTNAPEDAPLHNRVLALIAQDDVTTEKFLSNLIVSPYDNETWQIKGFYGPTNYDKFVKIIEKQRPAYYRDYLKHLIDATTSFHNMNYIMTRSFEQFPQQSEGILHHHLDVLDKVPGVSNVHGIYEELFSSYRATNTMITVPMEIEIERRVKERMEELREIRDDKGYIVKGLSGGKMEDWEIKRALSYGRNYHRVAMRQAEHSTLSELPKHGSPEMYVSSPQTNLTQILNLLKYVGIRFSPQEQMGGPELLKKIFNKVREARQKRGVRIKTLQGTSVDMREFQGVIGARGLFASWRVALGALEQVRFLDNDGRITNVWKFFEDHTMELQGLENAIKKQKLSPEQAIEKRKAFLGPLLNGVSIDLGLLVSPNGISGLTPELKQMVWEKIADLNPLVMATMLTRLEFDANAPIGAEAMEDILLRVWGNETQRAALKGDRKGKDGISKLGIRELKMQLEALSKIPSKKKTELDRQRMDQIAIALTERDEVLKSLFEGKEWQELTRKLRIANIRRLNDEALRIRPQQEGESLEDFKKRVGSTPRDLKYYLTGEFGFTNKGEQDVFDAINSSGKIIAQDLAKIKQSHAWFLDDVPLQSLNWARLGQIYNRLTNDTSNFNKSAGSVLKIISNPFGRAEHDIVKDLKEAVDADSNVLGLKTAQDNLQVVLESYLDMITTKPFMRQVILKELLHMDIINKATSRAQEIAGLGAPSISEDGTISLLKECLKNGILRTHARDEITKEEQWDSSFDDLKKKRKLTFMYLSWAKIRDITPIGLIALVIEFFKGIRKGK